jgi:hypothetical protein
MDQETIIAFLIRGKQHTYAGGQKQVASSRPSSHDLKYSEGTLSYIDTYLGSLHFIGEEAVWEKTDAVWGMNYYGKTLVEEIPQGFGEFLKAALMRVPIETPYRGPAEYKAGNFSYFCRSQGEFIRFQGEEEIFFKGERMYWLGFQGGEIKELRV